ADALHTTERLAGMRREIADLDGAVLDLAGRRDQVLLGGECARSDREHSDERCDQRDSLLQGCSSLSQALQRGLARAAVGLGIWCRSGCTEGTPNPDRTAMTKSGWFRSLSGGDAVHEAAAPVGDQQAAALVEEQRERVREARGEDADAARRPV